MLNSKSSIQPEDWQHNFLYAIGIGSYVVNLIDECYCAACAVDGEVGWHRQAFGISPLPKNTEEVLSGHKKIVVCEMNRGQFANYLRMKHPGHIYEQYNKVQGLPFLTAELENKFNDLLK